MSKAYYINRKLNLRLSLSLFLSLFLTACPDNGDRIADCDPGWHPCENDPAECCLDSTSHNFIFDIDTLGENGSYLNDVAIVDEDNIWVVGYIKVGDSTYNAAHWNGDEWKILRLPAVTYSGEISQGGLTSIHAFNSDNIWCFSDIGSYVKWDGFEWDSEWIPYRDGGINAIWGSAPNDIYFVGDNGSIVHYDGSGFERMESGTEVDLVDIWGTNENEIWAVGDDTGNSPASVILQYDGNTWSALYEMDPTIDHATLPTDRLLLTYDSIWTDAAMDSLIVVGAWGIFHVPKNGSTPRWAYHRRWDWDSQAMGYPLRVRGRTANDVFVCGKRHTIMHYNGRSWRLFWEFYEPGGPWLQAIGLSDNTAFFVGDNLAVKAVAVE